MAAESSRIIYGISEGSYSDYEVVAIFSTREKRDWYLAEYVKVHLDAVAEDFDFDPDEIHPALCIDVKISKDGTVRSVDKPTYRDVAISKVMWFADDDMVYRAATDDSYRAIKAANEKRAQLLSLYPEAWGDYRKSNAVLDRGCKNG